MSQHIESFMFLEREIPCYGQNIETQQMEELPYREPTEFRVRIDGYLVLDGSAFADDPKFFLEDICAWRPDPLGPRGEAEIDLSPDELEEAYDLLMDQADVDGLLG